MVGGKRPKAKGDRAERDLAHRLGGRRVPLSGAVVGFGSDVIDGRGLRWEAKVRATGFAFLYTWLEGKDTLAVKRDRLPWLVVIPLERFLALVGGMGDTPQGEDGAP